MSTVPPPSTPPSSPAQAAPQSSGRRTGCWIAGCALGCVGLLVLVIGGAVGLGWFGIRAMSDQVARMAGEHPVVVEELGDVQEVSLAFERTGAEAQSSGMGSALVFEVVGSRETGFLILDMSGSQAGGPSLRGAELELPDGRRIALDGSDEAEPTDGAAGDDSAESEVGAGAGGEAPTVRE